MFCLCMSDCFVPPVRAMDATSSPTRWGSIFALELRSVRLLLPGLLQRFLLQKARLRLLAACASCSSVRQLQMLQLGFLLQSGWLETAQLTLPCFAMPGRVTPVLLIQAGP